MDISDISKVAGRKRMNNDVEKLRENVSRETAKIIKLKVAQDTAYWDLKEKLQQVEGNHERLHQNMVEVQMQHEALSARLQDELRLRPETLNRLGGSREMCAALEEYGERLRASVSRGRGDQAALASAYQASARRVAPLAAAARADLALRRAAADTAARADAARMAAEQLAAAERRRARDEEATAQALRLQLESTMKDLRTKEQAVIALQAEAERMMRELHAQAATIETLHQQAERQEVASRQEREELRQQAREIETEAERRVQDALQALERARAETSEQRAAVTVAEALVEAQRAEADTQRAEAEARLAAAEAEAAALRQEIDRLAVANGTLEKNIRQIETDFETYRKQSDTSAVELKETAARLGRELDNNTETISRLMADVSAETEARARADASLRAARADLEASREATARHQRIAREKDDELAKQMTIILEIRGEKERLQERIGGMQATIDNIQKELTGPAEGHKNKSPLPPPERETTLPPERTELMLYDFLSDSSVDGGDALDAREVRRRFEALASRRGPPQPRSLRPPFPPSARHAPISLSQVKSDLKAKSVRSSKTSGPKLEAKVRKIK